MTESETITVTRPSAPGGPASAVTVPAEIGSVKLLRSLGQGGMGVVWLGYDRMLGRDVAVKFLSAVVASEQDPHFAMFLEGARAAAAVRHPGLTAIYSAGVVESIPYLVMEYVAGPTLAWILSTDGRFPLATALAAMDAACAAVTELHDQGIIHRDIKPSNILIEPSGRLAVTDFGLTVSRAYGEPSTAAALGGTPGYIAPEAFRGEVSPRSDVFALGVTLYEMLTGEPPLRNPALPLDQPGILSVRKLQDAGVGPDLISVIERATHADAKLRYRTARHLIEATRVAHASTADWTNGAARLSALVRHPRETAGYASAHAGKTPSSSYYEQLAAIADQRRAAPPPSVVIQLPERRSPPTGIEAEVPCAECRYILKGLDPSGVCPECGEPAASSLRPDRLCFADTRWLASVARGQKYLLGSLLGGPLLLIGLAAVAVLGFGGGLDDDRTGWVALGVTALDTLIWNGAIVVGVMLITKREPPPLLSNNRPRPEVWTIALRLSAIAWFPAMVTAMISTSWDGPNPVHRMLVVISGLSLVFSAALAMYVRWFADRIPDRLLARRLLAVVIACLAIFPVWAAAEIWALGWPRLDRVIDPALVAIGCNFVVFCLFVYGVVIATMPRRHIQAILAGRAPSDGAAAPASQG